METLTTVLLWVAGLAFLGAGAMKALTPVGTLTGNPNMAWVEREGVPKARLAGATELVAAVVLLLRALGVVTNDLVAILAAIGLVVQMGLAAFSVHRPAGEPMAPPLALGGLSLLLVVLLMT